MNTQELLFKIRDMRMQKIKNKLRAEINQNGIDTSIDYRAKIKAIRGANRAF